MIYEYIKIYWIFCRYEM